MIRLDLVRNFTVKKLYLTLILCTIIFLLGMFSQYRPFIVHTLLVVSAGVMFYAGLSLTKYFSGKVGKIYLLLLAGITGLLALELLWYFAFIFHVSEETARVWFIPLYLFNATVFILALKWLYDFWVYPITLSRKGFYVSIVVSFLFLVVSSLLYVILVKVVSIVMLLFFGFISFNLFLILLSFNLILFFKRGIFAESWKYIIISILLDLTRNISHSIAYIFSLPHDFMCASELLCVYSYLIASYGLFKQKF